MPQLVQEDEKKGEFFLTEEFKRRKKEEGEAYRCRTRECAHRTRRKVGRGALPLSGKKEDRRRREGKKRGRGRETLQEGRKDD